MIYLNLIPSSLWYLNLRSLLSTNEWKQISLKIRQEQNFTCQFCNISIKQLKQQKYFHCHEMWIFDDKQQIVSLACLVTLCSKCHMATHFGFSTIKNKQQEAIKQILKVNHWTKQTLDLYLEGCFEEYMKRSNKKWTINFDSFKSYFSDEEIECMKKKIIKN